MPYTNIFSLPMNNDDDLRVIANKIDSLQSNIKELHEFIEDQRFKFQKEYTYFIKYYIIRIKPGFNDFAFVQALSYFLYFCTPNQEKAIINEYINIIHTNTPKISPQKINAIVDIFLDCGNISAALAIMRLYPLKRNSSKFAFIKILYENEVSKFLCKLFPKALQNEYETDIKNSLDIFAFIKYNTIGKKLKHNEVLNSSNSYIEHICLALKKIISTIRDSHLFIPSTALYHILHMRLFALLKLNSELSNETFNIVNTITSEAYLCNNPNNSQFIPIMNKCAEIIKNDYLDFAITLIIMAKSQILKLYYFETLINSIDDDIFQVNYLLENLEFFNQESILHNNYNITKSLFDSMIEKTRSIIETKNLKFYDSFVPDEYSEFSIDSEEISIDL